MRPPRPLRVTLALLLVAAVSACTGGGAPEGPDTDERIADVRLLRATVGEPAAAVGTAAATLVEALGELHADIPARPDAREQAVTTLRERDLARLGLVIEALPTDAGEDGASGPDVAAADRALADIRSAAEALDAAAGADLDRLVRTAQVDGELEVLVATWDEPGSRSEQLARLEETATTAETLATELDAEADEGACPDPLARRAEAARTVASHSRELRELVAGYDGNEFDRRRAELVQDPYGTGALLADLDTEDAACWRDASAVATAEDALVDAIGALEAALNPADLSEAPAGG